MSNKMVIQQPMAFVQTATSNQWNSEICDCTEDMSSCCFAFWCFPCFSCITSKEAGECLCLPLLDGFGLIPPITMSMRVAMRHRYGIEGTMCNDCVYSFFCTACTWCQMSREMKTRQQPITLVNAHMRG
ncbi:cornifelin homolog B [Esox lucius]|nr:cornifelin homolog B [Esox lucius]